MSASKKTSFEPTKHELAVQNLAATVERFQRYRLRQQLIRHMDQEVGVLGYIPDGFVISPENRTLHIYEIDGHSYTSGERIKKLEKLWWYVDGASWFMNLTVINLFTSGQSFFDDQSFVALAFGQPLAPAKVVA